MRRLFIYFAGIGDLVILVPVFRHLARTGRLDLLTRPHGVALFREQPFIATSWALRHPNRGRSPLGRWLLGGERSRMGTVLESQGYDEIIYFEQERDVVKGWVESWRGKGVVRRMDYPDGHPDRVVIGARSLGVDPVELEPAPRMELDGAKLQAMRDRLEKIGRRVIGIQAGSGPITRWPPRPDVKGLSAKQWAGFAATLLEAGEADAIVLQGGAREKRIAEAIRDAAPDRIRPRLHDWTGQFSLDQLMHVMAGYRALLSVDTGPAHLAAAAGCPVLAVFGPTDPRAYRMRGSRPVEVVLGTAPCQFCGGTERFKRCRDNLCLGAVSLNALMNGWKTLRARL
jgi:ADP-heptose:LPS heptosyltransferase